jgi:hypothetical protein
MQADSLLPWTPNIWPVYVSLLVGSNFGAVPDFQLPLFMTLSSAIFSPVDQSGVPTCSSQKKNHFCTVVFQMDSDRFRLN